MSLGGQAQGPSLYLLPMDWDVKLSATTLAPDLP